jgi:hypothetical protein
VTPGYDADTESDRRRADPHDRRQPAGALAAALRDARADACHATAGDPVVTAAGWSFIALSA